MYSTKNNIRKTEKNIKKPSLSESQDIAMSLLHKHNADN